MRASTLSFRAKLTALVVCALALMVVSLNLARPIQTAYQYSANVVASANRFAALEVAQKSSDKAHIRVRPVKDLLNELPYQHSASTTVPNLSVRAVDIYSKTKLTSAQLSKCLVSSSEAVASGNEREQKLKDTRWNRWRISVLEHQIENREHFAEPSDAEESTSPYKLVSAPKQSQKDDVLESLKKELEKRRLADEQNVQDAVEKQFAGNGIISLSTPWQIRITAGSSHGGLLAFCFAISLLVALVMTYIEKFAFVKIIDRHQGIDFDRAMHRMNVPVLGIVGSQPSRIATKTEQPAAENWLRVKGVFYKTCEWVLLLSMAISCARLMFDPVWRDLIIHSPLAAISSLVCHL